MSEDGNVRGYRTHAVPLTPTPRRGANGAKLSIELLPSPTSSVQTNVNTPVVSTQISTVGRTSNFYIQLIPSSPVEKFQPLPMSFVLLTNGRITLTGEFTIQPTKECQSKTQRSIQPEGQAPPACVFNGTLPIQITRAMVPYSTLLVYSFQPSFGFNVAESYRFSVAGLFQNPLTLNATVVPFTPAGTTVQDISSDSSESVDSSEGVDLQSVPISSRAQDRTRVQLSFTGTPGSTVGLNVIEYDGVMQGLTNEITKERVLQYLTTYEQVPIVGMPTVTSPTGGQGGLHIRDFNSDDDQLSSTTIGWDTESSTSYGQKRHAEDTDSTGHSDNFNGQDEHNEQLNTITQEKRAKGSVKPKTPKTKPTNTVGTRAVVSEDEEQQNIVRERMVC